MKPGEVGGGGGGGEGLKEGVRRFDLIRLGSLTTMSRAAL